MKITVIKKSTSKVGILAACPWVVDDPGVKKQ